MTTYAPTFDENAYPLNASGGRLHHSHSAAETLNLCMRKFYYSYVLRLVTKSSPAAEFGVVCHDLLERLCHAGNDWKDVWDEAQGSIPQHARVLEATFPNLPWVRLEGFAPWPMPPHWNSETRVYSDAHGLKLKGFVDLWTYHLIPALDATRKSLVISDLKVSGDPEKWGKDADQLAAFGQPLKYAYGLADQLGVTVDRVFAEHIYAKRTGRAKSFVVNARTGDDLGIPWEAVEKHWREQVADDSKTMLRLHQIADPEEVEASTEGCRAFGGCEFADICPAHPKNYIPFKGTKKTTKPSGLTLPEKRGSNNDMSNAKNALKSLGRRPTSTTRSERPSVTTEGAGAAIKRAEATLGDIPPEARAMMARSASPSSKPAAVEPPLSTLAAAVINALGRKSVLSWDDLKDLAASVAKGEGKTRSRFFTKHADELLAELGDRVVVHGEAKDRSLTLVLNGYTSPEVKPELLAALDRGVEKPPAVTPILTGQEPIEVPPEVLRTMSAPTAEDAPVVFVGCYPAWKKVNHIDEAFTALYSKVEESLGITYWRADKYGEGVKTALALLAAALRARKEAGGPLLTRDLFIPRDHPLAEGYIGLLRGLGFDRVVEG
jgi:hypothetical protein